MKAEGGGRKAEDDTAGLPPSAFPPPPSRGRVAGIDYGTVRIGVAIGDLEVRMASPFETYERRSKDIDAEYFKNLAEEERLVRWVVGLPVHLSGEESQKSFEARQFGKWLIELTGLPVDFYDERFTSAYAESMLAEANLTRDQRKARIDQLAAQIMLTAYLESGAKGQTDPGSLED
ncbi:MAG: Holliday junction resolvase RuvX [Planctomycetota bacterium]